MLDTVIQTVGSWGAFLNAFSTGGLVASAALVLEFILRMVPSEKPLSIGYAIADVSHALGVFFDAAGTAADKVLPNRLKK